MADSRRKKRVLTKRVYPEWYRRYAKVLSYEERTFMQPLREIRAEQAMLKALETPPSENDKAIEMARKLSENRSKRIRLVLQILDGHNRNLDLSSLKPNKDSPLSQLANEGDVEKQTLFLRQRAFRPSGYVLSVRSKWRLFWEDPVFMAKFKGMLQKIRRDKVVAKWRQAMRMVVCIYQFSEIIANIARTTDDVFKKFRETHETLQGPLSFQKNYFKATAIGKVLDFDTVCTLTKPERYRTPEQLQKASNDLRVIQSFAEFPAFLQHKLCSVAWYLEVNQDKLITREGQPAISIYFLLAGRVASVKIDGQPWRANVGFKVIETHHMGALLGAEGLTSYQIRDVSLYALEKCKVISVCISDYREIILENTDSTHTSDHISFLSQLNFMKFFPMRELVRDNGDNIALFYYSAGTVITNSMAEADSIFIVFKGNCNVLAEITRKMKTTRKVHLPPLDGACGMSPIPSMASAESQQSFEDGLHPKHSKRNRPLSEGKTSSLVDSLTQTWSKWTMADSVKQDTNINLSLAEAGSVEKLVLTRVIPRETKAKYKRWIHFKTLREGDVVGLENLDLEDNLESKPAKMALVSGGAEIISMSKEFLIENMSHLMKKYLRASSYIFPDEGQLKSELDRRHTWKRFQNKVMEQFYEARLKKTNKHSKN